MVFAKKNTFRSRKREVRLNKRRMIVSGAISFFVLLLGVGVWYGARRPEVTIASVEVEGGTTVSHDAVKSKVEGVLSGSYALLIPRRFSYIFPHDEIVEAVNSIPRVHGATVLRSSRNEITIAFDEYVPYALWCDAAPVASTTPSCIFVNEDGLAYADAPNLSGETLVRFVVEGRVPERGVSVYDRDALRRYRALSEAISEKHNHRLRAITETKDSDLILHLNNDVDVLIEKTAHIEDVFTKIESVFQSDEFKDKPLELFEYIDLRFGNKVYAKERGVGDEEATTTPVVRPVEAVVEPVSPVVAAATTTAVIPPAVSTTTAE